MAQKMSPVFPVLFGILLVVLTTVVRAQDLRCLDLSQCTSTAGCGGPGSPQGGVQDRVRQWGHHPMPIQTALR